MVKVTEGITGTVCAGRVETAARSARKAAARVGRWNRKTALPGVMVELPPGVISANDEKRGEPLLSVQHHAEAVLCRKKMEFSRVKSSG